MGIEKGVGSALTPSKFSSFFLWFLYSIPPFSFLKMLNKWWFGEEECKLINHAGRKGCQSMSGVRSKDFMSIIIALGKAP